MKHERTLQDMERADKVVLASGIVAFLIIFGFLTFRNPYKHIQNIKNNAVKTEMVRGNGR